MSTFHEVMVTFQPTVDAMRLDPDRSPMWLDHMRSELQQMERNIGLHGYCEWAQANDILNKSHRQVFELAKEFNLRWEYDQEDKPAKPDPEDVPFEFPGAA